MVYALYAWTVICNLHFGFLRTSTKGVANSVHAFVVLSVMGLVAKENKTNEKEIIICSVVIRGFYVHGFM